MTSWNHHHYVKQVEIAPMDSAEVRDNEKHNPARSAYPNFGEKDNAVYDEPRSKYQTLP